MKLLVLTPEPVDADLLRTALGDEVEGAEVLVVSPATNQSKLAFWVSDSDEAIAEAEARPGGDGRAARGGRASTPPATPARASPRSRIQDALATFDADRIVVFSHPEGDRDYREDEGLADAEERFGVPLTHARDRPLTGLPDESRHGRFDSSAQFRFPVCRSLSSSAGQSRI